MGLFRNVRRKHKIRVDGPATIEVRSGRASIEVHHGPGVKAEHDPPPPKTKIGLTKRPKG